MRPRKDGCATHKGSRPLFSNVLRFNTLGVRGSPRVANSWQSESLFSVGRWKIWAWNLCQNVMRGLKTPVIAAPDATRSLHHGRTRLWLGNRRRPVLNAIGLATIIEPLTPPLWIPVACSRHHIGRMQRAVQGNAQSHSHRPTRQDTRYNRRRQKEMPAAHFSFFALGPLTFAVPRRVFCRFLRCLPVGGRNCQPSPAPTNPIFLCHRSMRCPGCGVVERTLLPARLLDLGGHADTDQPEVRLELLHRLGRVVDEGEAGGLAATELGAKTENIDLVLLGLVHAGKLLAELLLRDVGAVGVEDVTVNKSQRSAHRFHQPAISPTQYSRWLESIAFQSSKTGPSQ